MENKMIDEHETDIQRIEKGAEADADSSVLNYDEMEAGRILDALVAEKVMGWRIYHCTITSQVEGFNPHRTNYYDAGDGVKRSDLTCDWSGWSPSTRISDAWQVFDKLQEIGLWIGINTTCDKGKYDIQVLSADLIPLCAEVFQPAPLGICRAALKAVQATKTGDSPRLSASDGE